MAKIKPQQISTKMYGLLSKAMERVDGSLAVLEKEEKEGKEGKGGIAFLGQQLLHIAMAYSNLRKDERDSAKSPLAADQLSPEDMKTIIVETFSVQELEEMLASKQGGSKDEQEADQDTPAS